MKTILLLGGFGFIGSNILDYIDNHFPEEYKVIVFDRYSKHLDGLTFKCVEKVYAGDFSDKYLLGQIFKENKIDMVLHSLSASVPSSSVDNTFDIQNNVIPTINMLDIMTQNKVDKILFISSGGAIYGDQYVEKEGHSERDVLFPKSSYGVSKLIIEKYLYLYNIQYNIKSLILRLSNPFGPYHYSKKQGIINIALESAMQGSNFQVWGNGEGLKDYIFIEDFCKIVFNLIRQPWAPYRVLNIGSGNLLSVNQIVNAIKMMYPEFKWDYKESNQLDVSDFKLNLSLLKDFLDWPLTSLSDGLIKTKKWYESRHCKN